MFIFLRSLLLTSTISFLVPVLLIGLLLVSLSMAQQVPLLTVLGQGGTAQAVWILSILGGGDTLQGLIVIGLTCSLVGALFDSYAFYCQQSWRRS